MSELSPDVPRVAFDQQSEWYEETIAGLRAKLTRVTAEWDAIRRATADEIAAEIEALADDYEDSAHDLLIGVALLARRVGGGGGGGQ